MLINAHHAGKWRIGGFLRHTRQITKLQAPLDKVKPCVWINILMKVSGIRSGWNQQMNLHRLVAPFRFLHRLVAFFCPC